MTTCWLVINLESSHARWTTMQRQADRLNLPIERMPAIDAKTLSLDHPGLDRHGFWRDSAMQMRDTDAACFLSHLEAMRAFLDRDCAQAVILEDDVEITSDLPRLVDLLTADPMRDRWDMVKFTGNNTPRIVPCHRLDPVYSLGVPWTRLPGAAAYLVNRRAAQVYLDRLLPMTVLFDHVFDRGWALGLKTRAVTPLPASGLTSDHARQSTIDTPDRPRIKNRGLGKATSLWWRTKNETGRFAYATQALLRARLFGRRGTADQAPAVVP